MPLQAHLLVCVSAGCEPSSSGRRLRPPWGPYVHSVLCPQRQAGWRLDILGGRCCRRGCCGLHTPKLSPIAWTCPAVALPHSLDQTNVPPGLTGDAPGVGGVLPATILLSLELLSPSLPTPHWAQPGLGLPEASGHPPSSEVASSGPLPSASSLRDSFFSQSR